MIRGLELVGNAAVKTASFLVQFLHKDKVESEIGWGSTFRWSLNRVLEAGSPEGLVVGEEKDE